MAYRKSPFPRLKLAASGNHQTRTASEPDALSRQAGVLGAGPGSGVPPPEGSTQPLFRLRILATTDIHAQLLSYDYFANRPQFGMGLAQTASLIAQARAEAPDAILLDNGDFLQGSALAELAAMPGRRTRPHPAITAFNVLGYDAAALGNHEFNYGLGILREAMAAARFPVISANVALQLGDQPTHDTLLAAPYALIRRRLTARGGVARDITVGVLGLTPPEILDWDHGLLAGKLEVRPMVEAARGWVPEMRRAGADLVVCLAHTGIADVTEYDRREGMATEIAAIDGVDAIVAGHSHLVFPNTQLYADPRIDAQAGFLHGKPTVQPGHSGSHLGVIDLTLTHGPFGWKRHEARARAISASEVVAGLSPKVIRAGANPLRAALGADHRSALSWTRRTLGKTLVPLTTYFAQASDSRAMRVLAAAKIAHVAAAIEGRPEAQLPIIAGVTPFRTGGRGGPLNFTDIAAGPLSVRHVFDLYPFPNSIVASIATGAQILARLEAGTAIYRTIQPGEQDQLLIDPTVSGFGLELFPGLTYQIDLSRPRGIPGRIRDLRFEGRPVDRTARFVVASNSFRLGTHPELAGEVIMEGGSPLTSVIAEFLRASGEVVLPSGPGWVFAPLQGASVVYDSGAGAMAHMDEVRELSPRFLGITDEGFHRFRLHL